MTTHTNKGASHLLVLLFATLLLASCSTMRNTNSTKERNETHKLTTDISDHRINTTTIERQTDSTETIITETITTTIYSEPDTTGRQHVLQTTTNKRNTRRLNNAKSETSHQMTETDRDSTRTESSVQHTMEHRDSTIETKGSTQPEGRSGYDKFVSWGFWILLGIFILTIILIVLWICIRR